MLHLSGSHILNTFTNFAQFFKHWLICILQICEHIKSHKIHFASIAAKILIIIYFLGYSQFCGPYQFDATNDWRVVADAQWPLHAQRDENSSGQREQRRRQYRAKELRAWEVAWQRGLVIMRLDSYLLLSSLLLLFQPLLQLPQQL